MYKFNLSNIPDSVKLSDNKLSDSSNVPFDTDSIDDCFNVDKTNKAHINVSINDLNDLNIIINDNECSNSLIEELCEQLLKYGLSFSFSRDENSISVENAVIITLDQQYVSGPKTVILAPYNNERNNFSDALALSLFTSFRSQNIEVDDIYCGRRGYRQTDDGISTRVPTPTEDSVTSDTSSSFVTVAFGTTLPSIDDISISILNGLARYAKYISSFDTNDLIYRTNSEDTLDYVAERFNSTVFELSNFNHLDTVIPADEAIINPNIKFFDSFNKQIPVNITNDHIMTK